MLFKIISKYASSLQVLNLSLNNFTSASTEKLLTRITECGVLSTLKILKLYHSATFKSRSLESVKKIADILATAPVL